MAPLLQNLCLSKGDNEEACYCLKVRLRFGLQTLLVVGLRKRCMHLCQAALPLGTCPPSSTCFSANSLHLMRQAYFILMPIASAFACKRTSETLLPLLLLLCPYRRRGPAFPAVCAAGVAPAGKRRCRQWPCSTGCEDCSARHQVRPTLLLLFFLLQFNASASDLLLLPHPVCVGAAPCRPLCEHH
jgi:hypothetical protein